MIEKLFAGVVVLVCAGLLLRMVLGPQRQHQWDRFWQRQLVRVQSTGRWLKRQWQLLRSSRGARQAAEDAIQRARRGKPEVDREGNVIRPRSFRRDDSKKPPLH
ncbi:MAG: hypothetical protein IPI03_22580 [Rubrivivax sp.]|jgi:hypothetical protein|nr:hypothetical protein [Rubrivivax sp.]MBK7264467.1 hypothetical protein [Rubrivivax sp.]MBK8530082.1 hypothetical protein [Rubrivivax sp.]